MKAKIFMSGVKGKWPFGEKPKLSDGTDTSKFAEMLAAVYSRDAYMAPHAKAVVTGIADPSEYPESLTAEAERLRLRAVAERAKIAAARKRGHKTDAEKSHDREAVERALELLG